MAKQKFTETLDEVLKRWRSGDVIWTAELGGMGPGYEQAIQVLLFEICAGWKGETPTESSYADGGAFGKHVDETVHALTTWGFSGAQVGAAKHTAFQFLTKGYSEMMNTLPDDRRIMVSNCLIPGRIEPVQPSTTV